MADAAVVHLHRDVVGPQFATFEGHSPKRGGVIRPPPSCASHTYSQNRLFGLFDTNPWRNGKQTDWSVCYPREMADRPMTSRGAATRERIVDVATQEFAEHGIAGARVDRIVAAATTNKAQLYAYFGNKEGLFDAIFADSLERIVNVVPIDATDLAGWAVRLYDEYLRRPDLIRLATWARLERRPSGHLVDAPDRLDDHKLGAIADAQAAGVVVQGDPFDVMAMVITMSMAWSPVSNVYAATADEPQKLHERRRSLLRECVRRAMMTG
ncbi:TetR/AcrR family transcriptional regulator [Solicola gregarius]|uniref:TetR/AcrR family transcriptional regulator n=1 Tax=Solicola gregarius TaxID=2908642 RepID=A0AA46YMY6_9ACTN|nr:TetR/AcrR family transcriptional regulator [Solicola gregarius]UYM06193.1 TetR/AcrR family transcriptional regulator [Solicola gregarius]